MLRRRCSNPLSTLKLRNGTSISHPLGEEPRAGPTGGASTEPLPCHSQEVLGCWIEPPWWFSITSLSNCCSGALCKWYIQLMQVLLKVLPPQPHEHPQSLLIRGGATSGHFAENPANLNLPQKLNLMIKWRMKYYPHSCCHFMLVQGKSLKSWWQIAADKWGSGCIPGQMLS